jgi:hypothetical protein
MDVDGVCAVQIVVDCHDPHTRGVTMTDIEGNEFCL